MSEGQEKEARLGGHGREQPVWSVAPSFVMRIFTEAEAERRRAHSDVGYGAAPEQVPAEGWVP